MCAYVYVYIHIYIYVCVKLFTSGRGGSGGAMGAREEMACGEGMRDWIE